MQDFLMWVLVEAGWLAFVVYVVRTCRRGGRP